MKQKLFEPLAGAKRDSEGTLVYRLSDKELALKTSDAALRRAYKRFSSQEPSEFGEEDADDLRAAILDDQAAEDMPFEEWDEILDRELSVFKNGENYD